MRLIRAFLLTTGTTLCMLCASPAMAADTDLAERAARFVAEHEQKIRPLEVEVSKSWWLANTTGESSAFERKQTLETQLDVALANPERFAELKALHEGREQIADPILQRQIVVLYLQYLAKQVDPDLLKQIIAKSNAVEQAFNVFRPQVDGAEKTDNEVRQVLSSSKDSARRRAY